MFDLEQAIGEWRRQMLVAGIESPGPLEELESHLREEIERQMKTESSEQRAFEISESKLGRAKPLKTEFQKIKTRNWNMPLAGAAWILFVGSLFLPSVENFRGWQCVVFAADSIFDADLRQDQWRTYLWLSVDLANVLMLISPILLWRYSKSRRNARWLRLTTLMALAAVWCFCSLGLAHASDRQGIQAGFFVWMGSFLLLFLATLHATRHIRELSTPGYV